MTSLYRILKVDISSEVRIAKDAMQVVNDLSSDLLDRMIDHAMQCAAYDKKSTLSAKHAQAAVQLLMTGKLQELAVSEGTRSVHKFADWTPPAKARAY